MPGRLSEIRRPLRRLDTPNLLLQSVDSADLALLEPHLERVSLVYGDRLAAAGEPIGSVCFPEGAVSGFLDVLPDGRKLTVGLIGREGFVGWPLLMGNERWPFEVQVRGQAATALRLDASRLREAVDRSAGLRDTLLRYASTFIAQMGRTIVSNLIHSVERRAARWILLYHDRIEGDEITLTHDELGFMLGVRRASITDALHGLEGERAIIGGRGRVIVRDRTKLIALAQDTYGHAEAEYRRLLKPAPQTVDPGAATGTAEAASGLLAQPDR